MGFNSIENLRNILSKRAGRNIFLVTGKKSYQVSGAERILERLLEGYNVFRFYDFSENPKINDVLKGISCFRKNDYDLVIAVGGGSVIDMAKLINVLAAQDEEPADYVKKSVRISRKGRDLIAIPTTAGSGSEATHFAVLYIDKIKYSLAHDYILPDVVIVDPQFSMNLPSELTAVTAMDALSQAVESYWSVNSTEESKKYAEESIKLILNNLLVAVHNQGKQSRLNMAKAAFLAGKAINITKTSAPHALSYVMTSYFGVAHGQAVSLTLPAFLVFNYEVNEIENLDKRGMSYVKETINEISRLFGCKNAYETKDKILSLIKKIGLKMTFKELGIEKNEDFQRIIDNINIERLLNNPRKVSKENLEDILRGCFISPFLVS